IFSSAGTSAAAAGRVVDTLVGAAAGLAGGLVFAGRPQVQPARSAVGHLAGEVAGLLDQMAADLDGTALENPVLDNPVPEDSAGANPGPDSPGQEGPRPEAAGQQREEREEREDELNGEAAQWLTRARALRDEIERVDDALRKAAD